MGDFRFIVSLRRSFLRGWQLITLPRIDSSNHIVRIAKPKHVDGGELTPQAFEPVKDEGYLSVHWLEYFGAQDRDTGLAALRQFLLVSPFNDFKPQQKGRLAVIQVTALRPFGRIPRRITFHCRHVPRTARYLRSGHGRPYIAPGFDPHAGVFAMPLSGARLLAVQQYLLSRVSHVAPGKI